MQLFNEDFLDIYEELSTINEVASVYKNGLVERAKPISLADCRMIASDVTDIRGEVENSACLLYNGVLTRVAAQALIFRDGLEGKEVLMRTWRSAIYLPGGGVDLDKDGTDAANTIHREVYEEVNIRVTNVRPAGCSYWEYSEKPWVAQHVANPEDRWNGYYTWLFTADYEGEGDNDLPEEAGRYRWHKVQDILARPDTKKLKFIKEAIISNGYDVKNKADVDEPALEEHALTEERQIGGYVSYAIQKYDKYSPHPLKALDSILSTEVILASTEEDGTRYVSTSRNLLSHLGNVWKCALVLDGDKLTQKYKTAPINYNSLVYFAVPPESATDISNKTDPSSPARREKEASQRRLAKSDKTLKLLGISKFQALDDAGYVIPDKYYYTASLSGSGFKPDLPEKIYEILKRILRSYNAQWIADSGTGRQKEHNKNNYRREVSKFYELCITEPLEGRKILKDLKRNNTIEDFTAYIAELEATGVEVPNWIKTAIADEKTFSKVKQPLNVGFIKRAGSETLPKRHRGYSWLCVETVGNNVGPQSGAYEIKQADLLKYKDTIERELKDLYPKEAPLDIASWTFYKMLCGDYENEAEERIKAKDVDFYNVHGIAKRTQGVDISGCIKGLLVDDKHRMSFIIPDELLQDKSTKLYMYKDGVLTSNEDDEPSRSTGKRPIELHDTVPSIKRTADKLGIPIILFDDTTTNQEVISLLDKGVTGVWAKSTRNSAIAGKYVRGAWAPASELLKQLKYDISYHKERHKKGRTATFPEL